MIFFGGKFEIFPRSIKPLEVELIYARQSKARRSCRFACLVVTSCWKKPFIPLMLVTADAKIDRYRPSYISIPEYSFIELFTLPSEEMKLHKSLDG